MRPLQSPAHNDLPQPPRVLERVRDAARVLGHPAPIIETLVAWIHVFILFHDKQPPSTSA